jgi:hypothetical protein
MAGVKLVRTGLDTGEGHAQAIPTALFVISFFSSGTKENDGDDFWSSLLLIVLL